MAKSERAKQLAAQQKAEAKAIREAKRNSDNPRDWSTFRQIKETYKITREYDPKIGWMLAGVFAASLIVCLVLFLILNRGHVMGWVWGILFGILIGITCSLLLLTNRTKRATYMRYEGQPGAGEVALTMLNKKKWSYTSAIAFTRQMDTIHRVVGPAGVILIADGNPSRLKQTLASEKRKHEQLLYDVPVHVVQLGSDEGQVKLQDLAKYIEKLPKAADKLQVDEMRSRLQALDTMRQRVPLPKGPMPQAKGSRRMMRGR